MASIVIDLDASQLQPYLDALKKKTTDWRPVLRRLGTIALRKSALKFAQEGPGWKPLSPATIARRRGNQGKIKILQDTGRLRQSVVAAEQGAPGSIYSLQQSSLEFGSNLVYAAIHQFGGVIKLAGGQQRTVNFIKRGKRFRFSTADGRSGKGKAKQIVLQSRYTAQARSVNMPARPYLPTLSEMVDEFSEVLVDYFRP